MKIATWNVNSVRSRLERLAVWLRRVQPDILCLQELKVTADAFPIEALKQLGYHASVYGQKTYNGVAILSRKEPLEIQRGMNDGIEDPQARFLAAQVGSTHVISAYVPNGRVVGSDAWGYKLQWFQRLREYLARNLAPDRPVVLCGDFNVARDKKDVAHPPAWEGTVLFHPRACEAMESLLSWGLVDVVRQKHPQGGVYSWWDYRMLSFPKNDGLRLDYILATNPLAQYCLDAEIDRDERKGEKPSDHAPVVASFS